MSFHKYGWLKWFLTIKENKVFCKVSKWFYFDDFNLHSLSNFIPDYHLAVGLIRNYKVDLDSENTPKEELDRIDNITKTLYGLIHARFIVTTEGLSAMQKKYKNKDFGTCPRVYCEKQPTLPIGLSDIIGQYSMKLYCPKCRKVYNPTNQHQKTIDGAFFGTTFAHSLLNNYKNNIPIRPKHAYVPRIYGFKISPKIPVYFKKTEKNSNFIFFKNTSENKESVKEGKNEDEKKNKMEIEKEKEK
ncbi:casein kinase ii subunit beta [Anaeramoeba flamelloides]|uniref:Casein kinase II subunit beta n=1 Tax=Anaeramoeba flamelloides TaxID=1746091 RepID=A0AAV8AEK6_9EUKA|nr:casein kinase ii subunit beta [Anaeramoeba flamelloides]